MSRALALALVACVLSASGCLFVGEINSRPVVQLQVDQPSTELGVPLKVRAYLDDDQGVASLEVQLRNGQGVVVTNPCVMHLAQQRLDGGVVLITLALWRADTYTLKAVATDALGASGSSASLQFSVIDTPPRFPVDGALPHAARAVDACQTAYVASGPIPIVLANSAADPDASAPVMPSTVDCGPLARPIKYHWKISDQPSGRGYLSRPSSDGVCPAIPDAQVTELDGGTLVCLYPDAALPSSKASPYTIAVSADDDLVRVPGGDAIVFVIGESPACLDGAYPEVGAYVVPVDFATDFRALGVDDVTTSSALIYRWSLRRAGEADYTVIVDHAFGADGGGRLAFDPTLYSLSVGDEVSLRAEVTQPDAPAPMCAPNDDLCTVSSCAATGDTCPRRAVWTLEVR